jgi:hypothetical protein
MQANARPTINVLDARTVLTGHPLFRQEERCDLSYAREVEIFEIESMSRAEARYCMIYDPEITIICTWCGLMNDGGTMIYKNGSSERYLNMRDLLQIIKDMEHKYALQLIATGRRLVLPRPHAEPTLADITGTVDPWYTQDAHLYQPRR